MAESITRNSTNAIEVTGLRRRDTGEYVTDATIDADLLTAAGAPVSGGQNLVLSLVQDTVGLRAKTMYRGSLPSSVVLTTGTSYILRITATQSGAVRELNIGCIAVDG